MVFIQVGKEDFLFLIKMNHTKKVNHLSFYQEYFHLLPNHLEIQGDQIISKFYEKNLSQVIPSISLLYSILMCGLNVLNQIPFVTFSIDQILIQDEEVGFSFGNGEFNTSASPIECTQRFLKIIQNVYPLCTPVSSPLEKIMDQVLKLVVQTKDEPRDAIDWLVYIKDFIKNIM